MTKHELKLNTTYYCKISNKIVEVKIISADFDRNRYSVLNTVTGRTIVLGSCARLREKKEKRY